MVKAIHTIDAGFFKLDGGAMFGVVPKSIWSKLNPPDENNMCTWALRCLLIETEDRKILVDTGMGNKQDEKFRSFFSPHGENNLKKSIQTKGFTAEEITDVFLTHLHFDHCGGAVDQTEDGRLVPAFPNATYWSNKQHWDWAMNPNDREKASFLKENFVPLVDHHVIQFIEFNTPVIEWIPGIHLQLSFGHTEAMMLMEIHLEEKIFLYTADLLPSSYHIPFPFIMAYDVRPLVTLEEKQIVLANAAKDGHIIIFEHDPVTESCPVKYDDRGRIVKA